MTGDSDTMTSQPLLILGVHRSGTSVLSRVVQDLGVHMGHRQDTNAESTFFQRLNRRLDQECGGHWSTPAVVHEYAKSAALDKAMIRALRSYVDGFPSIEYWGPKNFRQRRAVEAWGWKDPRTGHLLPIWHALYPRAKIIWIERHPGAAASSLIRRSAAIRSDIQAKARGRSLISGLMLAKRLYRGQPILSDALRIQNASDALLLALEYAELHRLTIPNYGADILRLRYEDLVTDRLANVRDIAKFLGAEDNVSGIRTAVARLNTDSRDRYAQEPEVREALATHRERVEALGFRA